MSPHLTAVEAGAIFSEDKAKNSPDTKMTGSWMFFHAENMEKAREWLENDICECGAVESPPPARPSDALERD